MFGSAAGIRRWSGFSLIELIAVMVVLSILAAIALPRFMDFGDDAKESADEGALGAINSALKQEHIDHRVMEAPKSEWVTSFGKVAASLQFDELPRGIRVDGEHVVDQRGNRYALIPETEVRAARLVMVNGDDSDGGGSGGGDSGSGGGGGSGGSGGSGGDDEPEDEGGVAALPPQMIVIGLLPLLAHRRRS